MIPFIQLISLSDRWTPCPTNTVIGTRSSKPVRSWILPRMVQAPKYGKLPASRPRSEGMVFWALVRPNRNPKAREQGSFLSVADRLSHSILPQKDWTSIQEACTRGPRVCNMRILWTELIQGCQHFWHCSGVYDPNHIDCGLILCSE
jgi:hypothetical protein